ncbi:LAS superfamily LD-carboxypeptidase LdcB [Anoxybacillus calidus]|uniref:LAS superfamily LD-carboxypeptidase LdcB n=1 Tax=[Anoxybacillus] calidus TaxID=575178 RepID=A0A7V9Z1W3_9BACL|nr:LAS superfamily LD-carboxypeptidase LdcB [Anoxybacillus calidus]
MTVGLKELLEKAEVKLKGVHPVVASKARQLITNAYKRRINVLITQGFRSIEEQNELYAQGRTKPGKIVTNAKGGYSYHNVGLAIDFCLLVDDKKVVWDTNADFDRDKIADWMEVVEEAKKLGFE